MVRGDGTQGRAAGSALLWPGAPWGPGPGRVSAPDPRRRTCPLPGRAHGSNRGLTMAQPVMEAGLIERITNEVGKRIVGQDEMVERLLICLLTGGHILLEGVP